MFRNIFILILLITVVTSCDTEFSVNGDYEEKPIIHFLLDQGKEYQFMKLNKTYLKEGDALEFAQNPSLHYFDHVEAVVQEVVGGSVVREWVLQDTTIQNKKENGVFYAPEQKLYFFKVPITGSNKLREDALYRLNVVIDNGKYEISGQTRLVEGVNLKSPLPNQSYAFMSNSPTNPEYTGTPISFSSGNAASFKMQLVFNYEEYTASGSTNKSVLWNLGSINASSIVSGTGTVFAAGEPFYEHLRASIPAKTSDIISRRFRGFDVVLTAASLDLQTYILTNAPSSSVAQSKPTFSNVEGAMGIFSSRYTLIQVKSEVTNLGTWGALNSYSLKELCSGPYTAVLGFCSDIPADAGSSYYCP